MTYEPQEDSFLLLKHIKNSITSKDKVLDMGTGSGILAREVSKFSKQVTAIDIDNKIIKELSEKQGNQEMRFIHSDLFSNIKNNDRFNVILFNPPYLPSRGIQHIDLDGGKNGAEIMERFLKNARAHLESKGKIFLLCSSLNKDIEKIFTKYNYNFKKIDETSLFFEKLFVYELK